MLFNSLHFLAFFPTVTALYFLIPHRFRSLLLLLASYYFYMSWNPWYGVLMLISTITVYISALLIERASRPLFRLLILFASILINVGILFTFKYFNFFVEILSDIFDVIGLPLTGPTLELLLPIGISFYTFQAISYVIDVVRGTQKAERRFGIFALYVSFFPQLVAGPIERSAHLLPQFYERHVFEIRRVLEGLKLMIWGFFKKIVIADSLAAPVSVVFGNPTEASGVSLFMGVLLFAFQIYADFSGYTDIARGTAKVLGFNLVENFRRPYAARSISEFWQRWHISLTSWFQDYVFTPLYLAFSRLDSMKLLERGDRHLIAFSLATLVGLTLLGLWHGAGMNFIVFGFSQAVFIIIYQLIRKRWDALNPLIANAATLAMVLFGFVFFRAHSVSDGWYIVTHVGSGLGSFFATVSASGFAEAFLSPLGFSVTTFVSLVIAVGLVEVSERLQEHAAFRERSAKAPLFLQLLAYEALILWIVLLGSFGEQPFIYFQF